MSGTDTRAWIVRLKICTELDVPSIVSMAVCVLSFDGEKGAAASCISIAGVGFSWMGAV